MTLQDELAQRIISDTIRKHAGGSRNRLIFHVGCQLRDNGFHESDALSHVLNHLDQIRALGNGKLSEQEAMASVRSAFTRPPRDPSYRQQESRRTCGQRALRHTTRPRREAQSIKATPEIDDRSRNEIHKAAHEDLRENDELQSRLGLSLELVDRYKFGVWRPKRKIGNWAPRGREFLTFPVFHPDGTTASIKLREIRNDGSIGKVTWTPTGLSPAGLIGAHLLEEDVRKSVIMVSGEKDLSSLAQVWPDAVIVAPTTGESTSLVTTLEGCRASIEGRSIQVLFDFDEAGKKGSRARAQEALNLGASSAQIFGSKADSLFRKFSAEGKDITDFLEAGATAADVQSLLNDLDWFKKDGSSSDGSAPRILFSPLARANDQEDEPDELWRGRIRRGQLTLLVADEGLGKSLLVAHIVSQLSIDQGLPDNELGKLSPTRSLIFSSEDSATKYKRRCRAMIGDLDMILFAKEGGATSEGGLYSFAEDSGLLEDAIRESQAELVVFDPLEDFMEVAGSNAYRSTEIRRRLRPVAAIAERTGAAILLVHHTNKSVANNLRGRTMGSSGYRSTARSVLYLLPDPDDEGARLLFVGKTSSDEERARPLRYHAPHVDGNARLRTIAWDPKPVNMTAEEALSKLTPDKPSRGTKLEHVQTWLFGLVEDNGTISSQEVERLREIAGHSVSTVDRARSNLVSAEKIEKKKMGGRWFLQIPQERETTPADKKPPYRQTHIAEVDGVEGVPGALRPADSRLTKLKAKLKTSPADKTSKDSGTSSTREHDDEVPFLVPSGSRPTSPTSSTSVGTFGDRGEPSKVRTTSHAKNAAFRCHACNSTDSWINSCGREICGACHPSGPALKSSSLAGESIDSTGEQLADESAPNFSSGQTPGSAAGHGEMAEVVI